MSYPPKPINSEILAALFSRKQASPVFGSIAPSAIDGIARALISSQVRRKVFFSFHYSDIMRVNNVRKAGEFLKDSAKFGVRFIDKSLWETRKLDGEEAIKRLIREGMVGSSVVCVLVGSSTWKRRWVRYEIARSVVEGKGLVAVHLNSLNHHQLGIADLRGWNPLEFMGVSKLSDGTIRLVEQGPNLQWCWYSDYTQAVTTPRYLSGQIVREGVVTPLSAGTLQYDYVLQNGSRNITGWLDLAAKEAGN